jgi:hypothetical protein
MFRRIAKTETCSLRHSHGKRTSILVESESLRTDAGLERRCFAEVEELAKEFRLSEPPFSWGPLLRYFQITRVTERPLDRDACLKQGPEGLYIEVNSLYSKSVRRMGIAHEIGHLIVSQCSAPGNSHWGHHDGRIEDLCDRLAVILLAPRRA